MAIIGIDIGTQSLKVVVTDDDLHVIGEAARSYGVAHPRPGWAEQDPALWERALAPAVADALAAAAGDADVRPADVRADVRAIGVSGQLDGCVAVGADGAPLAPCLIWMDKRADDLVPGSITGDGAAAFLRTTGLVADASHMAAKIAWLQHEGVVAARYHQPVSYLVSRLTGEHVYDHGLASTTMLYALAARAHAPDLLALFGVDPGRLPDIRGAADIAGALTAAGAALTGLPAGIPVAVGTGDDFATPLGAGVAGPGQIACVLGTAEVVGAVSRALVFDDSGLLQTHSYAADGYFIENPGWMAGGALAWMSDVLGVADFAAVDALAATAPPGADGLIFLPALAGAMAPAWVATARGCFYGLTPGHGRGHLARAVMEGCAMAMCDVTGRLAAMEVPADRILALGGGARSALWGQIRADASGLPVALSARADTCPLGAAALAAVAAGIQPDLDRCAALLRPGVRSLDPDPARRAVYDDLHARYRTLFDALRPLY